MYVFVGMLSKTISFLQMRAAAPKLLHITAHIRAAEPNSKSFPILQPILLAQSLKKNAKQIGAFECRRKFVLLSI
jgi:hypothetical protein